MGGGRPPCGLFAGKHAVSTVMLAKQALGWMAFHPTTTRLSSFSPPALSSARPSPCLTGGFAKFPSFRTRSASDWPTVGTLVAAVQQAAFTAMKIRQGETFRAAPSSPTHSQLARNRAPYDMASALPALPGSAKTSLTAGTTLAFIAWDDLRNSSMSPTRAHRLFVGDDALQHTFSKLPVRESKRAFSTLGAA
jgi:hypothetical protein